MKLEVSSASALTVARAMRRVAKAYGDIDLAKAAEELHSRAAAAIKNRQSLLGHSEDHGRSTFRTPKAEVVLQADLFSHHSHPSREEKWAQQTCSEGYADPATYRPISPLSLRWGSRRKACS
jgi:hypothetical protein